MARGALRSFGAAWIGLVVLQAVTTNRGSGAVAGGFGVIGGLAERVFSPNVAAIPDRAHATGRDAETDAPAAASAAVAGASGGAAAGAAAGAAPKALAPIPLIGRIPIPTPPN